MVRHAVFETMSKDRGIVEIVQNHPNATPVPWTDGTMDRVRVTSAFSPPLQSS
jgi:hypothetical protein